MPDASGHALDGTVSLLDALRAAIAQHEYAPLSRLPSERELAERYGVSRHQVRVALRQLIREGRARRFGRGGTLVEPPDRGTEPPKRTRLQCVTYIRRPYTARGPLRAAIETQHLAGYTEALEGTSVKMRFAEWRESGLAYNQLLAPAVPLAQQGCVLVDAIDREFMEWLAERHIAFAVQCYCSYELRGLPEHHSVTVNKAEAAFVATRHLLELGHRRIGFIGITEKAADDPMIYNYSGYQAALLCAGLEAPPNRCIHLDSDELAEGIQPALRLLSQAARPTAVVTQTDTNALAVLRAARELGLHVPRDLSVVGFNDQEEAGSADPPLTTFAAPRREQGRRVTEIVLAAAEVSGSEYERICLPCRLVVRASTAPPADATTAG